jgi:bacterial/archaeal transporter family-2 protein
VPGSEPSGMSRSVAFLLTLGAGLLIGLQPPANAALSKHVGDFGAAFVSLAVSLAIIGVLLVLVGHPGRLSGLTAIKPVELVGALGGAVVVLVGLVAVKPLGAGAVIALLVAAQLVTSVIADRFGWFGVAHAGIGAGRVLGVVLVCAGTLLVTRT